ncbi:MAG: hypothetical protein HY719_10855, partial [Planctomycetes bacterium]|nr:hypothetical protein [Planctomycetota bacterium]
AAGGGGESGDFSEMKNALLQEMRAALANLRLAGAPGEPPAAMSEAEMAARMAMLEHAAPGMEGNFDKIGRTSEGDGSADKLADLLGDI